MNCLKSFPFLVLVFLFTSCVSTDFSHSEWHSPLSLDELSGTWVSASGEFTYPLVVDGKKYLRLASPMVNDTNKWKNFAERNDMDLSDLWLKRFSLIQSIYSTPERNEIFPDADENGTQKGRKFFIGDDNETEKIFSRVEILVPENILAINLSFFQIHRDGMSLRAQGIFHLVSTKFPDISTSELLFYKMKGGR